MPDLEQRYNLAKEQFAEWGVDADAALQQLSQVAISMHCWQGDDVTGFEGADELGGGLAVTGSYPGKARTPDELRADLDKAYALIPGDHRLNLHACYAELDGATVERDELQPEHFASWIDWAKTNNHGLDFNPTYFSHPKADDGFTLSSPDEGVRKFWIDHGIACREIGASMGAALGSPCVTNIWIPDGYKDLPIDRRGPRERLAASLDAILAKPYDKQHLLDAVESKLFGIGSESYVVGSHEFYLGYAVKNQTVLCLDAGHFHPTELLADKLTSVFQYVDQVLLHVSRGVRWDSDHVVLLTDELNALAQELVRGEYLGRTHIGLDFFDASINRVAAWVIGTRATLKSLLRAMLEPIDRLTAAEQSGDLTTRLALLEEAKQMPWGAVWDYHCERSGVPASDAWLAEVKRYESDVLAKRN
ncbi:L-rhamnose isomerase [Posidoniimonas corsicana]|uniref:L-rhamnose isomerase n=1 Tax=Posidoniimonas corsicana TaxID=1938618 RepID=A0A5C5V703_9BACT|nr:L-rhamnose isomerase [Posidoniimonas corsicana]TWT33512.1 L-rhamnose isomerase [Posidoniimonas corsicana]